jgi:hypothetical protein
MKLPEKLVPLSVLSAFIYFAETSPASNRTWIAADGEWSENGPAIFWSSGDEPDFDDVAISTRMSMSRWPLPTPSPDSPSATVGIS